MSTRRTAVSSAVLPTVVVAIVLGIRMHALASSQMLAMGAVDHAVVTASTPDDAPRPVVDHADTTPADAAAQEPGMGTMAMLCAAMVLSAGALLLLLFAGRRLSRAWCRPFATRAAPAWSRVTEVVTARPPPEWEFSVIRC